MTTTRSRSAIADSENSTAQDVGLYINFQCTILYERNDFKNSQIVDFQEEGSLIAS